MDVLSGEMPPGSAHSIVSFGAASIGSCLFPKWETASLEISHL